jgi:hypothetical protein
VTALVRAPVPPGAPDDWPPVSLDGAQAPEGAQGRDAEWTDDSLALLQERLAAPLPPRIRRRKRRRLVVTVPARAATLTDAERSAVTARAKRLAPSVARALETGDAQYLQRVSDAVSRDVLWALALVLGEAADRVRLRAVCDVAEDCGRPVTPRIPERQAS